MDNMKQCIVNTVVIISFLLGFVASEATEKENIDCMRFERSFQRYVDMEQLLGTWFGHEIITHNDGDKEGVFYYNTCVRIHISNITSQFRNSEHGNNLTTYYRPDNQFNFLKLIWEENDTVLEYTIRNENSRRGLWISSGPQNGDLINLELEYFRNTIQVMKAVSNHLVLTFCNNTPGNKLFSITLSRKLEALPEEDLESARRLLGRRGLSTSNIGIVCSSGSMVEQISSLLLLLLTVVIRKCL